MTIDLKDHFFKALKSHPNFSEAHLQLALLYQKEGDTENTLKHFELAISTDLDYFVTNTHQNITRNQTLTTKTV